MSPRLDLPLAVLAWCVGFLWLGHSGSWLLLAFLAIVLATRLIWFDPNTPRMLAPRLRTTASGLLAALTMVAATYAFYGPICSLFPQLPEATRHLYGLLFSGAPSSLAAVLLVVIVSASEEILWRGRVLSSADARTSLHWPTRAEATRVLWMSAIYGAAHLASRSITLVAVAFLCGVAWGLLRVATTSLWAPIITHVLWDLVVVFVWPLA